MEIMRRLGKFVQKIAEGLRKPDVRFVGNCVLGLMKRGSVMLTEIGRGLDERLDLAQTEKRLSRMAKTEHFDDDRLRRNYLKAMGPTTKELPFVCVDLSEIVKPYAVAMEDLCIVRDASSRTKEKLPGYWVFEAAATDEEQHQVLPLLTEVYSTESADFVSENDTTLKWLRYLMPFVAASAIWLFDRGFDRGKVLGPLSETALQWVVRMRGDRDVVFQTSRVRMSKLAASLDLPHETVVRTRTRGSRDVEHPARYTFVPVHLRGFDRTFGLVVVDTGHDHRLMFLTWRPPKSAREAGEWVRAYFRRWGVEDSARACKQLTGLEDVRVLSLRAISRLVRLAGMVLGWLGYLLQYSRKTADAIMAAGKFVGKTPLYKGYRLMEGLRALG